MSSERPASPAVLWIVVAGLLAGSACAGTGRPAAASASGTALSIPRTLRVRVGNQVQTVDLEAYVIGSALSEFSPVGESPAAARRILEVQTVLARTYAVSHLGRHRAEGFDLCDTTHCQVYQPSRVTTSRFAPAAIDAGRETSGALLAYRGRPAQTLFHADCGGETTDAADVWGGDPVPYLRGGPDDVPAGTHREWTYETTSSALQAALNGDDRTAPGRTLTAVEVVSRDPSGRAAEIEIRGDVTKRVRGDVFRAVVTRTFGAQSLLSTRMSVARTAARYRFSGQGFGHGVGLCQVGAAARARQGASVAAILAAYYPGGRLMRPGR